MSEPARSNVVGKTRVQGGGAGEILKVVIQALLIAIVVRTLLFQPFNIPSGSMIPTLLVGDYLFVSKYAYGYSDHSIPFSPHLFSGRILASQPKRGDVIVFKLPRDGTTDYIKRLIGLPGRQDPDERWASLHQRHHGAARADQKDAHRGFLRARDRCADLQGNAAGRRFTHDHRDSGRHGDETTTPMRTSCRRTTIS